MIFTEYFKRFAGAVSGLCAVVFGGTTALFMAVEHTEMFTMIVCAWLVAAAIYFRKPLVETTNKTFVATYGDLSAEDRETIVRALDALDAQKARE